MIALAIRLRFDCGDTQETGPEETHAVEWPRHLQVTQALTSAQALNQSQSACKKTKLIVFLGTPHRGSAYAGWAEIVSNLARLIGQEANTKALRTLGVNSEVLDNIHEGFKVLVHHHDIKIHTFQESRSMPVAKGFNLKV